VSGQQPYKGRDRFAQKAKDEGYAARSVYKLEEIVAKTPILRRGDRVVDLGCFPGSWSHFAAERIGDAGVLVGVDLQAPRITGPTFLVASVYDVEADALRAALGGPADVVLSDMAPNTAGDRIGDHLRQIDLARRALELATALLRPGGAFVCKVFEGGEAKDFENEARAVFSDVRRIRPEAVRKVSKEWFLVATGFRR
jgi:23S rRNA (uridine2552-2'-O)-methyltransferase